MTMPLRHVRDTVLGQHFQEPDHQLMSANIIFISDMIHFYFVFITTVHCSHFYFFFFWVKIICCGTSDLIFFFFFNNPLGVNLVYKGPQKLSFLFTYQFVHAERDESCR